MTEDNDSKPPDLDTPAGLLAQVVEREGRLLRTTIEASGPGRLAALAFTFDVGTVRLEVNAGSLAAEAHPAGEGEASTAADEEDPWWTVLGNPLARVQDTGNGLLVQFRPDSESPKIVLLEPAGDALQVRVIA